MVKRVYLLRVIDSSDADVIGVFIYDPGEIKRSASERTAFL